MSSPNRQPDLFGLPQADLFDGYSPAEPPEGRLAATARQRLTALLAEARAAARMPWDPQKAEVNALIFHHMANWLPAGERDTLRTEFRAELARLRAAG